MLILVKRKTSWGGRRVCSMGSLVDTEKWSNGNKTQVTGKERRGKRRGCNQVRNVFSIVKHGRISLTSVGHALRRLAVECTNGHVITRRSQPQQPQQLGAWVAGGAEEVIHTTRRFIQSAAQSRDRQARFLEPLQLNQKSCTRRGCSGDTPEIYRSTLQRC